MDRTAIDNVLLFMTQAFLLLWKGLTMGCYQVTVRQGIDRMIALAAAAEAPA